MIYKQTGIKYTIDVLIDFIIITASLLIPVINKGYQFNSILISLLIVYLILLPIFLYENFYTKLQDLPKSEIIYNVLKSTLIIFLIANFISSFFKQYFIFDKLSLIYAFVIMSTLLILSKAYLSKFIKNTLVKSGIGVRYIVLIGDSEKSAYVKNYINKLDHRVYKLKHSFIINNENDTEKIIHKFEKALSDPLVNSCIIALNQDQKNSILRAISKCRLNGVDIFLLSDFFDIVDRGHPQSLYNLPIITLTSGKSKDIALMIKRFFDILISILAITILSPLMLLITYLIKLESKGPAIFRQERIGEDGKPFIMYKFRSMYYNSGNNIHKQYVEKFILEQNNNSVYKLKGDNRITRVGKFLRETSLDELPQFFNVLKGDMSMVGPRPAIDYEVDIYKDWHKKRFRVKPGITGLWQVNGRSKVKFNEMVILDIYYIENWSLFLDLKISLKTIPVVIKKEGAY
ncbi:MAG: exopolysaccharide biosynthesis polyprenyl glycosylphosphotransferase [Proteobacteria bacterium]|nr:exopolysaccharide biosynthesis polyprenyl glycosylphosphotransferase [Pseudomonadota bacterium]